MLEDIRRIFRRSVEAFREELEKKDPEDQVSDLLSAMRRELVAVRAAIPEYQAAVDGAAAALDRERDALTECERRGALAAKIGDKETTRVAGEFAARHRERIDVLEKRLAAAEAELSLRRREADEMARRYREADANRFALLSQLRRARATESLESRRSSENGPMGDWSRMEERVARDAGYSDALDELTRDESASGSSGADVQDLEARLAELKRRLGKE